MIRTLDIYDEVGELDSTYMRCMSLYILTCACMHAMSSTETKYREIWELNCISPAYLFAFIFWIHMKSLDSSSVKCEKERNATTFSWNLYGHLFAFFAAMIPHLYVS